MSNSKKTDSQVGWEEVLLFFYRRPQLKTKYPLAGNEPIITECFGYKNIDDVRTAIQNLKNLGLLEENTEKDYPKLTKEGFDVALHLEERCDAKRNNEVISVLTLVIASATIIQVATDLIPLNIFLRLLFFIALLLFTIVAYQAVKQNMFLKD